MLTPNSILQDRYRVIRELGHGGMGTVYEALDQRVNCLVALKETIAGNNNEARQAFEREASLLGNLRHSALPKVMDFFSEDDGDFLIMEFIPGYDLAELLDLRGEPFPQAQAMRWADELLRVLEYLHGQRPPILHRDIKPSNLKLTKQGEIFLLDFGLAKGSVGQMSTLATSRSLRGYTPIYASLEQIHAYGTDARSDIYSLGATLYHLLTGVAPIDAPARFHAIEDDQHDPLLLIQELSPQVSANVAAVIHSAMAISRKHRPSSATEMRKALRNATEEDERSGAEEEYARAESKRRELEKEKRRASEGTATLSTDEERPEIIAAKAKETEEKTTSDRAEEPERASGDVSLGRAPLLPTVSKPAPTVPAIAPEPAVKTVPALSPERMITDRDSAPLTGSGLAETGTFGSKRVLMIAAGVVVVAVVATWIVWSLRGNATRESSALTQPQSGSASPAPPLGKQTQPAGYPHPAGMVYVPGGAFMMGRDNGDEAERPAHQVTVKPFFIDTDEVTNEDYEKFVKATNHRPPPTWKNGSFPSGAAHKPVTSVTWDDANDYARWAGKRLPTEEEWEFAARGAEGHTYPWGNEWQQGSANANGAEQSMADVAAYKGTSPFGAYDMVGNAWEWTGSNFKAYPGRGLPASQPSGELRVIRGGCYESTKDYATTTYRAGWPARGASTYDQTGFRCARDFGP